MCCIACFYDSLYALSYRLCGARRPEFVLRCPLSGDDHERFNESKGKLKEVLGKITGNKENSNYGYLTARVTRIRVRLE